MSTIDMAHCPECGAWAPRTTTNGDHITAHCTECGTDWSADESEFRTFTTEEHTMNAQTPTTYADQPLAGRTYTKAMVDIDGAFGPLPALVWNEQRWNGFALPLFTIDVVRRIQDVLKNAHGAPGDTDYNWVVIDDDGSVWEGCTTYADEYEDARGTRVQYVDVDGVPMYGVGDGWCWSEVPEATEDANDLVYARCLKCGYSTTDAGALDLWNGYGDHVGGTEECLSDHRTLWVLRDGSVAIIRERGDNGDRVDMDADGAIQFWDSFSGNVTHL